MGNTTTAATAPNPPDQSTHTIHLVKELEIAAPIDIAFEAILEEMGPGGVIPPDGKPFPMVVEAWPGGRWCAGP